MAENIKKVKQTNTIGKTSEKSKAKRGSSLIIAIVVLFLLLLFFISLYFGIYFKLIDLPQLAEKYHLSDSPIIGQYFPKPKENTEPSDLPPEQISNANATMPTAPNPPPAPSPQDNAKLIAAAKQEETKRIGKLARLYEGMNPEEAVPILNQLDDTAVLAIFSKMDEDQIAKIMAQMDPKRAARLTQSMLKGQKQ
jgi:hypothetical protein